MPSGPIPIVLLILQVSAFSRGDSMMRAEERRSMAESLSVPGLLPPAAASAMRRQIPALLKSPS